MTALKEKQEKGCKQTIKHRISSIQGTLQGLKASGVHGVNPAKPGRPGLHKVWGVGGGGVDVFSSVIMCYFRQSSSKKHISP